MKINEVFELLASQMNSDFKRSKGLSPELRKIAREKTVRDFLRSCLPKSLGVSSGQVISTKRTVEGEVDIVIYDTLRCPVLPIAEGVLVFPIEGVYILIEVETYLDRKELRSYVKKCKKLKSLPKTAYYEQRGAVVRAFNLYGKEFEYFPTLSVVFAFDSSDLKNLVKTLNEEYDKRGLGIEQQIDLVCILNKGSIAYYAPKRELIEFPSKPDCQIKVIKGTPGQNLLMFYTLLMRILTQAWTRPIKLLDYTKQATFGKFI